METWYGWMGDGFFGRWEGGYSSFLVANQSAELSFAQAMLADVRHVSKRISRDTGTLITQAMNAEAKLGQ